MPEKLENEISKLPTIEMLKKGEKFIISQKIVDDYEEIAVKYHLQS